MEEQKEQLKVPQAPMTIVCKCDCEGSKKQKWSVGGVFARVFAVVTAFVMSLFMPIFVLIFLLIVLVAVGASVGDGGEYNEANFATDYVYGDMQSTNKVLQIPINGIILGDQSDGTDFASILSGGVTYGYDVKDYLRWAADQDEIKAVVLSINSPGGTIVGSQAIADAVAEYREVAAKPVFAHVSGVGASGAYWAAASTDKIYADAGSITGSIGVVMGSVLFYDSPVAYGNSFGESVQTENGIKEYGLSAGKGKDFGNPFRAPTEEELSVYRASLENEYARFVSFVAKTRGIEEQLIRDQIGAYVYDNVMAQKLKLIDGTQMRELTYEEAAKVGGVERDFQVVSLESIGFWGQLFAQAKGFIPNVTNGTSGVIKASSFCMPKVVVAFHGDMGAFCR